METSGQTSKVRVKWKTLLLQLDQISEYGTNLRRLAEVQNCTKQALNWRLKRLIQRELVKKSQSYPYSIYELTELGKRVKGNLRQSERGTPSLWKAHNLIIAFPIISYGTFTFTGRKTIQMANWFYTREIIRDFVINIQDTGLLKIYCPKRLSTDPDQEFAKLTAEATKIAQDYCNRYDMKLGTVRVIRKGQKSLYNSEKLAKSLGRFSTPELWVDASEGTDELEESQDSHQIEQLLDMPKQMSALMEAHNKLAINLNLHIDVLNKMSNSLDLMNQRLEELGKAFKEVKL